MEPSPPVRTLCASSTRDTRAAHAALTPGTRLKQTLRDQGQLQEVAWSAYLVTLPLAPEPEWPLPGCSTCRGCSRRGLLGLRSRPPRRTGTRNVSGWVVAGLPCSVGATKVCGAACWAGSGRGGEVGTLHGTRPDASTSDFAGALDCFCLC